MVEVVMTYQIFVSSSLVEQKALSFETEGEEKKRYTLGGRGASVCLPNMKNSDTILGYIELRKTKNNSWTFFYIAQAPSSLKVSLSPNAVKVPLESGQEHFLTTGFCLYQRGQSNDALMYIRHLPEDVTTGTKKTGAFSFLSRFFSKNLIDKDFETSKSVA
ncbi:MAG: hypothetical protein H6500_06270 [Candidatus Woesearchaeota archaeon]|nr:hypothetical protein [Nanoarchaeota archaeon]USN43966.1 MAG: hypothetical protein H6500_06270 [Candidatus Woesearchaeota archaeon]